MDNVEYNKILIDIKKRYFNRLAVLIEHIKNL